MLSEKKRNSALKSTCMLIGTLLGLQVALPKLLAQVPGMPDNADFLASSTNCLWIGGTGSWDEPGNWTDCNDGVPGDDDRAVIATGTVLVPESEQINVAEITLSGTGNVLVIDGELVVGESLEWNSGTLSGQGTITISDITVAVVNGTITIAGQLKLVNLGQILWNDGAFDVRETARMENFGLFDIRHNGNRALGLFSSSQSAVLFNAPGGVIRKSSGTGTTTMETVFDFDNQGLVEVLSGSLLIRTETVNSGQMNVAAGALIDFTSQFGVSHQHTGTSSLTGAGEMRFGGGVTTMAGVYDVEGLTRISGGTAIFSMELVTLPSLILSSGVLGGEADIFLEGAGQWNGGTIQGSGIMHIGAGLTLIIDGSSTKTLSGSRTLENQGTILWDDGAFDVRETTRMENFGLFDIRHDGNRALGLFSNSQSAVLFNAPGGVIRKSSGTGTTTMETVFDFDNQGLVEVLSGTLQIRTQTLNSGQITVADGAVVDFTSQFGVLHQHAAGAIFSGDGEYRFSSGTSTFSADVEIPFARLLGLTTWTGAGAVTIVNRLTWESGTMAGNGSIVIEPEAELLLQTSSQKTLSGNRALENQGSILWDNGTFIVQQTARIDNHGLFEFRHDGNHALGLLSSSQSAVLFNAPGGVIRKSSGTGTTTMETVFDFDNQGLVEVLSGSLLIRTETVNSGQMNVAEATVLRFSSSFGTNHSMLPGSLFRGNGLIDFQAGVITNESSWQPGTTEYPGELTISGTVNLGASSSINTRITSSTEPGIGYDRLTFNDGAQLAGTLNISVSDGYEVEDGDEFSLIICNQGCNGTFENTLITPETSELEIFYLQNTVVARLGEAAPVDPLPGCIWTGAGSGNSWHTAANWICNGEEDVPAPGDSVRIATTAPITIDISQDVDMFYLELGDDSVNDIVTTLRNTVDDVRITVGDGGTVIRRTGNFLLGQRGISGGVFFQQALRGNLDSPAGITIHGRLWMANASITGDILVDRETPDLSRGYIQLRATNTLEGTLNAADAFIEPVIGLFNTYFSESGPLLKITEGDLIIGEASTVQTFYDNGSLGSTVVFELDNGTVENYGLISHSGFGTQTTQYLSVINGPLHNYGELKVRTDRAQGYELRGAPGTEHINSGTILAGVDTGGDIVQNGAGFVVSEGRTLRNTGEIHIHPLREASGSVDNTEGGTVRDRKAVTEPGQYILGFAGDRQVSVEITDVASVDSLSMVWYGGDHPAAELGTNLVGSGAWWDLRATDSELNPAAGLMSLTVPRLRDGDPKACRYVPDPAGWECFPGSLAANSITVDDLSTLSEWALAYEPATNQPPGIVTLIAPADGAVDIPANPMLTWEASAGAEWYDLQLTEDPDYSDLLIDASDIQNTEYQITDDLKASTVYFWRVRAGNGGGSSDWSESGSFTTALGTGMFAEDHPTEISLSQNYPNPFNPSTVIRYELPSAANVRLYVFDLLGQRVAALVDDRQSPGRYEVTFHANQLTSGVYLFRLETDDKVLIRKMTFVK